MAEELGWAVTLDRISFPVEVVAVFPRIDSTLVDEELNLTEVLTAIKEKCRLMGLTESEINDTKFKVELVAWAYGPEITKAVQKEFPESVDNTTQT